MLQLRFCTQNGNNYRFFAGEDRYGGIQHELEIDPDQVKPILEAFDEFLRGNWRYIGPMNERAMRHWKFHHDLWGAFQDFKVVDRPLEASCLSLWGSSAKPWQDLPITAILRDSDRPDIQSFISEANTDDVDQSETNTRGKGQEYFVNWDEFEGWFADGEVSMEPEAERTDKIVDSWVRLRAMIRSFIQEEEEAAEDDMELDPAKQQKRLQDLKKKIRKNKVKVMTSLHRTKQVSCPV